MFTAVAGGLAAVGHGVAGGHLPSPAVLIVTTAAVGGTVSGLTRRERTYPQILSALLLAQLAYHLLFELTALRHGSGQAVAEAPMDARAMLLFHLVAAIGSAWVMASGERALFALLAAWQRVSLVPRPQPAVLDQPLWIVLAAAAGVRRAALLTLRAAPRRGPPLPV